MAQEGIKMSGMKYLVVEVRKDAIVVLNSYMILEDGFKAYEKAKSNKDDNDGVYFTAILKEIDL